jgi:hypothetical protein
MKRFGLIAALALSVGFASGCNCGPSCGVPWFDSLHALILPCHYGPYPGNGMGKCGDYCGTGCSNCGRGGSNMSAPMDDMSANEQSDPTEWAEPTPPQSERGQATYTAMRDQRSDRDADYTDR